MGPPVMLDTFLPEHYPVSDRNGRHRLGQNVKSSTHLNSGRGKDWSFAITWKRWAGASTATIGTRRRRTWLPVRDAKGDMARKLTRVFTVAAATCAAIALPSCTRLFDAIVFNPCSTPAEASFGLATGKRWYEQTAIPAESSVRVANVMNSTAGTIDHVRVAFPDSPPELIDVRIEEEDPVAVFIDTDLCPRQS
jgi:hypothetical protein